MISRERCDFKPKSLFALVFWGICGAILGIAWFAQIERFFEKKSLRPSFLGYLWGDCGDLMACSDRAIFEENVAPPWFPGVSLGRLWGFVELKKSIPHSFLGYRGDFGDQKSNF